MLTLLGACGIARLTGIGVSLWKAFDERQSALQCRYTKLTRRRIFLRAVPIVCMLHRRKLDNDDALFRRTDIDRAAADDVAPAVARDRVGSNRAVFGGKLFVDHFDL